MLLQEVNCVMSSLCRLLLACVAVQVKRKGVRSARRDSVLVVENIRLRLFWGLPSSGVAIESPARLRNLRTLFIDQVAS